MKKLIYGVLSSLRQKLKKTETIKFQGEEYQTVPSRTGRIWLDRNLGAKRVAESRDDELAYGSYYAFDEVECPDGFRLPTEEEWKEEINSWSSKDDQGAFDSPLKLPMAGSSSNGKLFDVGSDGLYWSSTVSGSIIAQRLCISVYGAEMNSVNRAAGFSVRCIKD